MSASWRSPMASRDRKLEDLYEDIRTDSFFDELRSDSPMVPGAGPAEPAIPRAFILGGHPGAREALQGKPFVGQAGEILLQLMELANLHPAQCWMTYVLKYRTPGNRPVNPREQYGIDKSRYVQREWSAVGRPNLIIALGKAAWHSVGGTEAVVLSLSALAGTVRERKGVLIVPMLDPTAGLLGSAKTQDKIERDWEYLPEELERWEWKG